MDTKNRHDELAKLYYWLESARKLSEVMVENRKNIHGPLLTGLGQEAVGVGVMWGLYELGIAEDSYLFTDYRSIWGTVLAKSDILCVDLSFELMKNHYLKATSANRGRDGNVHISFPEHRLWSYDVSHTAAMLGNAMGVAEGLRVKIYNDTNESKRPVVGAFIGEGAAEQGMVHEVMNATAASGAKLSEKELAEQDQFLDYLARSTGVQRGAPLILVINVNQRSIYTDSREEHGNAHFGHPSFLAKRADGYPGWYGIDVDGDDAIEVSEAIKEAAARAQKLAGNTLIIAHTYRRTAHNEDQHPFFTPEEREELEASKEDDPIKKLRGYILARELLTIEEPNEIETQVINEMHDRSARALAEPEITIEEDRKDRSRFAPHIYTLQEVAAEQKSSRLMNYSRAALSTMEELLRKDPQMTFSGEDIAHPSGGVFGLWRGLKEKFGNAKVFNWPISEAALVGNLAGRASVGLRPWGEFEFAPFGKESAVLVDYVVGANYYQKRRIYPLVLINHFGIVGNGGSGHYHSNCTEADFYHNQGWKVAFPADAYDLIGMMRAAHEDPNPVVIYMQIYAHNEQEFSRPIPSEPYMVPLGKAAVKRQGEHATVVAYGACAVQAALNEAEELAKESINVEVLDLRTIVPLDFETVKKSAKKTGRVLVMHEASLKEGIGAYILADLMSDEDVFGSIRSPMRVIASEDIPIPSAYDLEWDRLPFEQSREVKEGGDVVRRLRSHKLAEAVRDAMRY